MRSDAQLNELSDFQHQPPLPAKTQEPYNTSLTKPFTVLQSHQRHPAASTL